MQIPLVALQKPVSHLPQLLAILVGAEVLAEAHLVLVGVVVVVFVSVAPRRPQVEPGLLPGLELMVVDLSR